MPPDNPYVVGDATWLALPRVRTKPPEEYITKRDGTGSGYERIRSYEYRPHTNRRDKEDVYVYHHRLLAVAWLFPDGWTAEDILPKLRGKDVHHAAPEAGGERGIKWDNREACLHLRTHAGHSKVTNAQLRAWAADAKASVEGNGSEPDSDACDRCGEETETFCRSDDWDGKFCTACAKDASDGSPIEVVG